MLRRVHIHETEVGLSYRRGRTRFVVNLPDSLAASADNGSETH